MNTENLTVEQKLIKIQALNSARQRKFYLINAEKLKEARRAKYKVQTDAVKQKQVCVGKPSDFETS